MPGKPGDPNAINGPHQSRREAGVAKPERPRATREGETSDEEGIEIDNAIERPQVGQPGQPGVKPN